LINYKTGQQKIYELDNIVTAMCWHPRMPNHALFGGHKGDISLCSLQDLGHEIQNFKIPAKIKGQDSTAGVRDIVLNPGEDVFLIVRSDGQFFLFGMHEAEIKMEFQAPQGEVSRAVWIDSVSGDFLVATSKAGVLRLYNAANPNCKEIIKVSRHGITDI
jgi:WD40 repeat protein